MIPHRFRAGWSQEQLKRLYEIQQEQKKLLQLHEEREFLMSQVARA